eukprot:jgi/Hompol1/4668/HPOL_002484-RA
MTNKILSLSVTEGAASSSGQPVFKFTEPSPDDKVKQARTKQPSAASAKQQAKSSATTAQAVSGVTSSLESMSLKGADAARTSTGLRSNFSLPSPALDTTRSNSSLRSTPQIAPTQSLEAGVSDSVRRTSSTSVTSVKASPKWKRVNIEEEYKKRLAGKERMNLVVV